MKLATRLLAPVNTTVISILGIGQLLMGLWLALPMDSWSDYAPPPLPEWTIGSILMIIGSAIAWFSLRTNLMALQWATTLGYLFWLITMSVQLIVHMEGTGWINSLIFAVYCFMISLNIRVNRRFIRQ